MLLLHRLLSLPSTPTPTPTSQLLLRPSRFPPRRPLSPCSSVLSHLTASQTVDLSDAEESHGEVQVQLPLDRLFVPPGACVAAGDVEAVTARVLKGSNIVLGPYARGDAQVVAADFLKSSVRPEDCPRDGLPEFALVGRSNVGKSSLLNSLVRRKRLALTSKKPGKTQCINHFKVNDSWYLVDLPGYGYTTTLSPLPAATSFPLETSTLLLCSLSPPPPPGSCSAPHSHPPPALRPPRLRRHLCSPLAFAASCSAPPSPPPPPLLPSASTAPSCSAPPSPPPESAA